MTEGEESLHPLVEAAGRDGRFPDWARCHPTRQEHAARVSDLLGRWAEALDLPETDRIRWRSLGVLHDALRDADPEELRFWARMDWPAPLLHGPATARRLEKEGVEDGEVLQAVRYHTTGHPDLADPGRYLYMADFLDPGRDFLDDVRERLRTLLPEEHDEALRSVVALRIAHRLEVRGAIRPETVAFWNRLMEEDAAGEAEDAGTARVGGGGGEDA